MSRSDIFDEYARIAEEKGLISKAEDSPKLKRYKRDTYPRAGSDDISTIEALYGVKPSSSIEYEHNIMEAAHPNSVIIAPSYDRLNGLVENNIERSNIMSNIALKPTTGNITLHRYAEKELLMELVRIANDMDARDKSDLVALADDCMSRLTEKKSPEIQKVAFLPWIIGGAVILAGFWLYSHIDDPDKGLAANIDNALAQLDDLKTNSWYESDVDDVVQRDIDIIERYINNLKVNINRFNSVMNTVYKPNSLSDINQLKKLQATSNKSADTVDTNLDSFTTAIDEITPVLTTAINNFTSSVYQKQHSKPSWMSDVSGWIGEGLRGRWGLMANDFISAANALGALKSSLIEARSTASNIDSIKAKYEDRLTSEVAGFSKKEVPGSAPMAADEGEEEASDEENEDVGEKKTGGMDQIIRMLGRKPTGKELAFLREILAK